MPLAFTIPPTRYTRRVSFGASLTFACFLVGDNDEGLAMLGYSLKGPRLIYMNKLNPPKVDYDNAWHDYTVHLPQDDDSTWYFQGVAHSRRLEQDDEFEASMWSTTFRCDPALDSYDVVEAIKYTNDQDYRCGHDYDCCGCVYAMRAFDIKRVKPGVYSFTIAKYRNY
jgi:hypothetical protein